MLALAAARLGLQLPCLFARKRIPAPSTSCSAAPAPAYDDEAALGRFADAVDVITYEFENVPAKTAAFLAGAQAGAARSAGAGDNARPPDRKKLHQRAQDRDRALRAGAQRHATCRGRRPRSACPRCSRRAGFGYDGKGQAKIAQRRRSRRGLARACSNEPCILEGFMPFRARSLGRRRARARRPGRMFRRDRKRAPRPHPQDLARAGEGHARGRRARRAASRPASPRPSTMSACWRWRCSWCAERQRPRRAGQRDRAARAQFRPLDHRRRDGVAVRAAHPRGRRLAAGEAGPARPRSR